MRRRRYNGYRGRITGRDVFRLALVLILIILVLAAAGLVMGQRYLMYTDEGVRLELPFFRREDSEGKPSVSTQVVQLPRPEPEATSEEMPPEAEQQ